MVALTRRHILKGIAAMPLALSIPSARAAASYVRYDLASPQGMQMLQIYAQAVDRMQAMGPDNPLSWMWQWYTHFVDGATTKAAEIDRIFAPDATTSRSLANETWNTCQSHAGQNSNHFLPWHRMFVFYFERIVRQVSGHPEFTLPYWDYTSTDPAKRAVVPEAFRLPDDPLFGCLYRPNRGSLANSGESIQKNQPTDVMDISDALSKTTYNTVDGVQGFCRAIDSGIHGRIHVLVGTTKGMGAVPYAGNDPLFWVHHANIDRMWASWNRNGGRNPTDATLYPWINNQFVMVDANGARVSRPLKSFFSVLSLGYDYDAFFPKPSTTTTTSTTSAKLAGGTTRVAASTSVANLGPAPVRVTLRPLAGAPSAPVLGLDGNGGRRTYLVLRNLHAWAQPEVLFHVYVAAPGDNRTDRAHYAGNINFFDAEFHDHGGGKKADALGDNTYSFDVTNLLRRVLASGAGGARDALQVTFVPAGTPRAAARPMVATIELVQR